LASQSTEEAQNPPGASHRVTSEPLQKEQEAQLLLETVRRESMPRIAKMDMEMTT